MPEHHISNTGIHHGFGDLSPSVLQHKAFLGGVHLPEHHVSSVLEKGTPNKSLVVGKNHARQVHGLYFFLFS